MAKRSKLPVTPASAIKSALRRLWLRSRERQMAIKRDGYSCLRCGKKQSRATGKEVYVEVHHKDGIANWPELVAAVRKYLLCDPANMETLCRDCHYAETHKETASDEE